MRHHSKPSVQKDLQNLLIKLCNEWGFCIPPSDFNRLVARRRLTADEFATEVLKAEGFDPPFETYEWYGAIKQRFIDKFGNEVSAGQT